MTLITLPPSLAWIPINATTITALVFAVFITFTAFVVLPIIAFTLPNSFDPSSPPTITEDVFSETDKRLENAHRSGYTYFLSEQETQGVSSNGKDAFLGNASKIRCSSSVQVLVLGELGRSPRMQYHALSLARRGVAVSLIGDVGTAELHPDLAANRLVRVYPLATFPRGLQFSNRLAFLLITAPLKVLWQITTLYHILAYTTPASAWLLLQNPPAIPTLAVTRLVCALRGTHLVVDWHNFGYSILALRLGASHPIVRLATWYEGTFGRGAAAHFAVSRAMTASLKRKWGIKALTLHDRPAEIFQPLTKPSQRESFLRRLPQTSEYAEAILSGQTRLLVSSTSWTPDEDFEILLQGLVSYATMRESQLLSSSSSTTTTPHLPAIHAIITGRGPLLSHYLSRISTLQRSGKLPGISILNAWLTPADYAGLLSSADLGVSLHMSSSGVDLPMKVVDMFGSGLPVVGWSGFESWGELVREPFSSTPASASASDGADVTAASGKRDGEEEEEAEMGNGRGFQSPEQLSEILVELFGEIGSDGKRVGWSVDDTADSDGEKKKDSSQLERLRRGARKEGERRWEEEWASVAGRLFGLEKQAGLSASK